MKKINLFTLFNLVLMAFFIVSLLACGGSGSHEDQKKPADKDKKETAEKKEKEEQKLTIQQFADAAEQYINKKTKENNGSFPVVDKERDSTLKLTLQKIHRKRLSHLGNNVYFVCANFYSQDSTLYDIDIFMKGTSKDNLEATRKPMVHKVEGTPRFTWYEEDGVWKTRPVKGKKDKKET